LVLQIGKSRRQHILGNLHRNEQEESKFKILITANS
jgi:hypothetical protein